MQRRTFITHSGIITAGLMVQNPLQGLLTSTSGSNPLPAWRGFNLLDFFIPDMAKRFQFTSADQLKWMRDWGFDFIRLPMAYPYYLDIDRTKNLIPADVYKFDNKRVDEIESLTQLAQSYGMHVSLNLHRAPGYCINAGFNEPYNLWKDEAAQDAFYFHWQFWARRFKNVSAKKISFDLLNEPSVREDMNDQHSRSSEVPGQLYRMLAKKAAETIRAENASHLVIADGNNVGNAVIPEISDLNIAQSCRGYYPHAISHYKAPWANKEPEKLPDPKWPGQVGNQYLSREMLEKYYQPWIDLSKSGVGVHCGECGCWNKTPHDVFLAWFNDVLDILHSNKIGFGIWNFIGDFGLLDSGRTDVVYVDWYGHKLDKKLLELLKKY